MIIKEVCKEKGITVSQLAEKMGIKQESLSRAINGNPTLETLGKIAAALNVPMWQLFASPNEVYPQSNTAGITCPHCGKISLSKPNDMKQLEVIQSKIYDIRGQKVMIDRDLAEMYGVETRTLNQAVKRNVDRFPEDFMFQLTDEETQNWKSQIVITNSVKMGMRRNPYAFTELGVAMLSSVLNSKTAIQINMGIMRAFVAVRQLIALPKPDKVVELQNEVKELKEYIEEVFADYNDINDDTRMQLELINQTLAELQAKKAWDERPRNPIGFKKPGD